MKSICPICKKPTPLCVPRADVYHIACLERSTAHLRSNILSDAILKLCNRVDERTAWDILDAAVGGALIGVVDADKIKELLGLEAREENIVA